MSKQLPYGKNQNLTAKIRHTMTLKELQERSDISVLICLLNETEKLSFLFKNRFKYDTRQAVNQFIASGRILTSKFNRMMNGEMEDLHQVSEAFGVLIEIARKQDETKFLELMQLIKAWDSGEVQIVNDLPENKVA